METATTAAIETAAIVVALPVATRTYNVMFRCPTCKAAHRVRMDGQQIQRLGTTVYGPLHVCTCGRGLYCGKVVRGRLNANIKCSAKCEAATGHDCECSCGGKNHGGKHAA